MASPLLYSTNVYLKYLICQRFRNNVHYVWCSDCFDAKTLGRYATGYGVAPSANPADIYRDLKQAVERGDRHNAKIEEQIAGMSARAIQWTQDKEITDSDKDEILYMVRTSDFSVWRPLVYVIPRSVVQPRLQIVPPEKRASPIGIEYIIPDLKADEFDVIEF